jgi:hypothetical protein
MDNAYWKRLQIPKLKAQIKDHILTLKWKMALNDVILKIELSIRGVRTDIREATTEDNQ